MDRFFIDTFNMVRHRSIAVQNKSFPFRLNSHYKEVGRVGWGWGRAEGKYENRGVTSQFILI